MQKTPARYLVALDLDGTSVRYEPRLEMAPSVMQLLHILQPDGYGWVMNSDRFTGTMIEIAELLPPDLRPAALLSCQRYIHINSARGYEPVQAWNARQDDLHRELWSDIAPHFTPLQQEIESCFTIIDSVVNEMVFAYMVPPTETPALRKRLQAFIAPWPNAQISGNHEWMFILHAEFSKARVLDQYRRMCRIAPENIIAIGDGFNDLTMLNGSVTAHVGCPANASPEIIKAVTDAGGFASDREGPDGACDIISYYHSCFKQGTDQRRDAAASGKTIFCATDGRNDGF